MAEHKLFCLCPRTRTPAIGPELAATFGTKPLRGGPRPATVPGRRTRKPVGVARVGTAVGIGASRIAELGAAVRAVSTHAPRDIVG